LPKTEQKEARREMTDESDITKCFYSSCVPINAPIMRTSCHFTTAHHPGSHFKEIKQTTEETNKKQEI